MSDLKKIEKIKLEKLFGMSGGYVLDFSNRTFEEFILESIGIEVYTSKYDYDSGSKANRLRAIWDIESNKKVSKLIDDMITYLTDSRAMNGYTLNESEAYLIDESKKIIDRLEQDQSVENLDAINPINDEKDFSRLATLIKESIHKDEPELALHNLHTFVSKFLREICNKHGIKFYKSDPIHNLLGKYIKFLKEKELINSRMTETILKSSISVIEPFNDVRNNKSLAHDNELLNYDESILIFNDIANIIKFVNSIESKLDKNTEEEELYQPDDDLPF